MTQALNLEIKAVRLQSPYRDLRTFAAKSDLSHEGLRKIEVGIRIPRRATLESIISIGKVPKAKADDLRKARDKAQAARDGLDTPFFSTDENFRSVSKHLVDIVTRFLAANDVELGERAQKILHKRFEGQIRKEFT